MTYDGVLATVLSGIEPAVSIALACLPLLRPLLGRRKKSQKSGYDYGSSGGSGLYHSKQGTRSAIRPFAELEDDHIDDNDNSSEVQLQPIQPVRGINISAQETRGDQSPPKLSMAAINVEKKFEVTSNYGAP